MAANGYKPTTPTRRRIEKRKEDEKKKAAAGLPRGENVDEKIADFLRTNSFFAGKFKRQLKFHLYYKHLITMIPLNRLQSHRWF